MVLWLKDCLTLKNAQGTARRIKNKTGIVLIRVYLKTGRDQFANRDVLDLDVSRFQIAESEIKAEKALRLPRMDSLQR